MSIRRWTAAAVALLLALTLLEKGPAVNAQARANAKDRDAVVEKAVAYLKSRQAKDGTWSKASSPGITGLVLIGLFKSGKVTAGDEVAARALAFIESMVDATEGHLASPVPGARVFHKNYITSVNLMALQASGQEKYKATIARASAYLKKLQWDEGQEKTPRDPAYGGVGYGPNIRPDLSNTSFFLDALKAAGVPASDPAYKKALVFISRCQNLKGEHNDQPWADKINDGSFIYVLAQGKGKTPTPKDDKRPGYGSMTAAGLKCLHLCGLAKDDARYKKALEWVQQHYTVEENPGRRVAAGDREGAEVQGLYYYLWKLALCLDALGIDEVVDAKGTKHDWRAEMTAALARRQRKDGSWANESGTWMEGNAELCTAYALMTLSHCKPRGK